MTQNEFYELKERAAESQLPFKLVDRAAIKYIGRFEDNGKPYDPTTGNGCEGMVMRRPCTS